MAAQMTRDDFIAKAVGVHGETYDYSRVTYVSSTVKVEILCKEHGAFLQTPASHLQGRGCPQCGPRKIGSKLRRSTGDFVRKAQGVHGNKYDYSLVDYRGAHTKVQILCPQHGSFWQSPAHHLNGTGCPAEKGHRISEAKRFSSERFIHEAKEIHGDRYDYSTVQYVRSAERVGILCRTHGLFLQIANDHLAGSQCPKCSYDARGDGHRLTQEEFLNRAFDVHGSTYDYADVDYQGAHEKVPIRCRTHGVFWQTPHNHLQDGNGCPSCVSPCSKGHQEVDEFIRALLVGEGVVTNTRSVIPPYELDTFIPQRKLAIEYNGVFWHSVDQKGGKFKHRDKFVRCKDQGIQLLQIDEHEWRNPLTKAVWLSILRSKLGKHERKIHARKTQFRVIDSADANQFLSRNHLQGVTSAAKWCFGLFSVSDDLVAVMTFSGHQKASLNLSRMAFILDTTVVGGAKKLFQNALPFLPTLDIITFANHRYSLGSIYATLGFTPDATLPPSYQWYYKGHVMNKRQCRHEHLPKLLGETYMPIQTEHENMFRAGARCLYDAGYQRWIYRGQTHL